GCGNTGSKEVTVHVDGAAPVVTIDALANCYADEATAKAAVLAASHVSDNCDSGLTPSAVISAGGGTCSVTYKVSATDGCGNTGSKEVTVHVDGAAPVVTIDALANCYADEATAKAAVLAASHVSDNCDSGLTPSAVISAGGGTCS